jgi:hypothetical protein
MRISFLPYHISDHLFLAETERLYETFINVEKILSYESDDNYIMNDSRINIQTLISLYYIITHGKYNMEYIIDNYNNNELIFSIMEENFDVYNIENLVPYIVAHNHRNKVYTENTLDLNRFFGSVINKNDLKK